MIPGRLLILQPLGRLEELEERLRDTTAALRQTSFLLNSARLLLPDPLACERAADAVVIADAVAERAGRALRAA